MPYKDEDVAYWMTKEPTDLAHRVATLHKMRRAQSEELPRIKVATVRKAVADLYVKGYGVEVGAGPRPFPIPAHARCVYGDIRDGDSLKEYFARDAISLPEHINAQDFAGVPDNRFDFVISAHVIEHLEDPIGSIYHAMRVLVPGGIHILSVPDLRHTFDRKRSPTTLDHLLADWRDGGKSTRLEGYAEFIRDVAVPVFGHKFEEEEILPEAIRLSEKNFDIHFHAWTDASFLEMLSHVKYDIGFEVLGCTSIANENIFVLRKR